MMDDRMMQEGSHRFVIRAISDDKGYHVQHSEYNSIWSKITTKDNRTEDGISAGVLIIIVIFRGTSQGVGSATKNHSNPPLPRANYAIFQHALSSFSIICGNPQRTLHPGTSPTLRRPCYAPSVSLFSTPTFR